MKKWYKIVELLTENTETLLNKEVTIKGWVRTKRGNKNVAFLAINDGSIIHNLQAVFDLSKFNEDLLKPITTGACVSITGTLVP